MSEQPATDNASDIANTNIDNNNNNRDQLNNTQMQQAGSNIARSDIISKGNKNWQNLYFEEDIQGANTLTDTAKSASENIKETYTVPTSDSSFFPPRAQQQAMYFAERHNAQANETLMTASANEERQEQRKQQQRQQQQHNNNNNNKYRDYYTTKKGKSTNKAAAQRFQQQQQRQQGNANSYRNRSQRGIYHQHNEEYPPPFNTFPSEQSTELLPSSASTPSQAPRPVIQTRSLSFRKSSYNNNNNNNSNTKSYNNARREDESNYRTNSNNNNNNNYISNNNKSFQDQQNYYYYNYEGNNRKSNKRQEELSHLQDEEQQQQQQQQPRQYKHLQQRQHNNRNNNNRASNVNSRTGNQKLKSFDIPRANRRPIRVNRQRWMEVMVDVNCEAYTDAYRYVEANFDIWMAQVALKGEIMLPGITTDFHRRALLDVAPQFGYTIDMRNTACNFGYVVETNKMYLRCFSHNRHVGPAIARELYRFEEQHRAMEHAKQQQQQQQENIMTSTKPEVHAPAMLTWFFCDRLLYHQVVQLIRLLAYEMGVFRGNPAPSYEQQRLGGAEDVEGHYEPCYIYKLEIGLEYQKAWETERQELIAEDRKGLISPFPLPRELWAKDAFMYRFQRFVKPFLYNWNPTITRCTIDIRRGVDFQPDQLPDYVRTIALLCGLRVEFDHYNTVFFRLSTQHCLHHFAHFSRYFKLQDEIAVEAALVELRHSRPDLKSLRLLEEAKNKTPHFGLFNFAMETNFLADDLHQLQRFARTNGYYVYIRHCDKIVFIAAVSRDLPELPKEQFELFFEPSGRYTGPETFLTHVDAQFAQTTTRGSGSGNKATEASANEGTTQHNDNAVVLPSLIHLLTEAERAELPAELQSVTIPSTLTREQSHGEEMDMASVYSNDAAAAAAALNIPAEDATIVNDNLSHHAENCDIDKKDITEFCDDENVAFKTHSDVIEDKSATTESVHDRDDEVHDCSAYSTQNLTNFANHTKRLRPNASLYYENDSNANITSTENVSEMSDAYSDYSTEETDDNNNNDDDDANSYKTENSAYTEKDSDYGKRRQRRRIEKSQSSVREDRKDLRNGKMFTKITPSVGKYKGQRRYFWPTSLTSTSLYKLVMSSRIDVNNRHTVYNNNNMSNNNDNYSSLAPGCTRETKWVQWQMSSDDKLTNDVDATAKTNIENDNTQIETDNHVELPADKICVDESANTTSNTVTTTSVTTTTTTTATTNVDTKENNVATTAVTSTAPKMDDEKNENLTLQKVTFVLDHLSRIAYPLQ